MTSHPPLVRMDDVDSRICTACMDGVYYFKLRPIECLFILIIIKQNWNQFLLAVKANALKQQISKILSANSTHRR